VDGFSFDRRELGQSVYESEVIGVIKSVPGVDYFEIDAFEGLTQAKLLEKMKALDRSSNGSKGSGAGTEEMVNCKDRRGHHRNGKRSLRRSVIEVSLAQYDDKAKEFLPAQLAYLLPDVPDTLILNEVKE
jgi:hypothetical protein